MNEIVRAPSGSVVSTNGTIPDCVDCGKPIHRESDWTFQMRREHSGGFDGWVPAHGHCAAEYNSAQDKGTHAKLHRERIDHLHSDEGGSFNPDDHGEFPIQPLSHLIGDRDEDIKLLDYEDDEFTKEAKLDKRQQWALIEENMGERARNFARKSDISHTHYEKHNKSEIAMMMPKGL